jgi:hypothetical protein
LLNIGDFLYVADNKKNSTPRAFLLMYFLFREEFDVFCICESALINVMS